MGRIILPQSGGIFPSVSISAQVLLYFFVCSIYKLISRVGWSITLTNSSRNLDFFEGLGPSERAYVSEHGAIPAAASSLTERITPVLPSSDRNDSNL